MQNLLLILEEIVQELGLNSFEDTSAFDWNQMSKNNKTGAVIAQSLM